MRYQQRPWSCGAAATVNALRCLGLRVPERIVRARAGTTLNRGTTEDSIRYALYTFGFDSVLLEERGRGCRRRALVRLKRALHQGRPVIICAMRNQHWVTVAGMLGQRFIVVDGNDVQANVSENGCHVLSATTLARTWKSRQGIYFGIILAYKRAAGCAMI